MKKLSLYIHIPFCIRKCAYCDFLSAPADEMTRASYVEALCREIQREAVLYADYSVETVFFGGGTPTVLTSEQLQGIINCLFQNFIVCESAEITMECNPGTATKEKLSALRQAGVNRLSIGLQSSKDAELQLLGRIHTWQQFLDTYKWAREAGFDNVNVDIMSALPGQTFPSYRETLQKVMELEPEPEHISAYSLIIEEGTPFFDKYHKAEEERYLTGVDSEGVLPSEEEERLMYEETEHILGQAGYHRYEISNYAKPGRECRHNKVYWTRGEYLGFGLGASSLIGETRFKVTDSLSDYMQMRTAIYMERNELCEQERMEEYMYLGLRMMEGVSVKKFRELFQCELESVFGTVIEKYIKDGLLKRQEDRISLTAKGIDISNVILADFLL